MVLLGMLRCRLFLSERALCTLRRLLARPRQLLHITTFWVTVRQYRHLLRLLPLSREPRCDGFLATASMVLASVVGCGGGGGASVVEAALINGAPDDGDLGVVGLAVDTDVYCSGTLIGDSVVVTAAHCIGDMKPTHVYFGTGPQNGGYFVRVVQARVHPSFDQVSLANDIGALLLADRAPAEANVWPILPMLSDSDVDAEVRLVGFGGSAPYHGPVVLKRQGTTRIDSIGNTDFYHHANPTMTCFGDSGGPAFLSADGVEYLAGVASGGDSACTDLGRHTRVDVYAQDFLSAFPNPTTELGRRCFNDDNCVTGICLDPSELGAFRYCSLRCADDTDCEGSLHCVLDRAGGRFCRPIGPGPGALGAPCKTDGDCASSLCTKPTDRLQKMCSLQCFAENDIKCPMEYQCGTDGLHTGRKACFPTRKIGCAVSSEYGTPGSSEIWVVLIALSVRRVVALRRGALSQTKRRG
jgi:hypothetical protein